MLNKVGILVFVLIIFTSACTPSSNPENFVEVPTNDSTPPTVGMTINDSKVNIDVNETSQPTAIPTIQTRSDTVSVIVGATDSDGGIKVVKLWATFTKYGTGNTAGPGVAGAPIQQDVSNSQIGEQTLKNRFFVYNFDVKKELGSWSSIRIDVWAEGENFYGGKASTPKVSIIYPSLPPASVVDFCDRIGTPILTLPNGLIEAGQSPGQQKIAVQLVNNHQLPNRRDSLLIIVDDAPDLTQDQMRVELDINPAYVTSNKAIEAWAFCHRGSRVDLVEASMVGGFLVGTACFELDPANDFRSGCTITQTMLLDRRTTSELWLRKPNPPNPLGIWSDIEAIDSSIWQAFGGRYVRFIWESDFPFVLP